MAGRKAITLEERFWEKVDKAGSAPEHVPAIGNCWVWTGSRTPIGYGRLRVRGGVAYAHRLSWIMHNGPVPVDKPWVCHSCDNRACVRPSHLWVGTPADDTRDMIAKGRQKFGCGGHGNAKLTESQVREIRLRRRAGEKPRHLARQFGVNPATIWSIATRRQWRHIQDFSDGDSVDSVI